MTLPSEATSAPTHALAWCEPAIRQLAHLKPQFQVIQCFIVKLLLFVSLSDCIWIELR